MQPEPEQLPHSITPPPALLDVPQLASWIALGLLVFVALFVVWRAGWLGRSALPAAAALRPEEVYQQELTMNRASEEPVKVRAVRLSEATRHFLHRRFGEAASFQTSEEMKAGDPASGPPVSPRAVPFVEVCEGCEQLRFEAGGGTLGDLARLYQLAEEGLQQLQGTEGTTAS